MHCFAAAMQCTMQHMKRLLLAHSRILSIICSLLLFLDGPRLMGDPAPAAAAAFSAYSMAVELRLAHQHRSSNNFLAPTTSNPADADMRLRQGQLIIERVSEPLALSLNSSLAGALLHHWRGTAFAPGAKAEDFEHLMRDFNSYPKYFGPQVLQARVLSQDGDRLQASMRIRQRHVITVVMDTNYDIAFSKLDVRHGYSISRSTRIAEIDSSGANAERPLTSSQEHGFLWRLNTYWSYEERDGGLYLQIEAVSLTRSIPHGLDWMIRPYVESIPRESMEFTLRSACNALRK
jgi:hypothetical protein